MLYCESPCSNNPRTLLLDPGLGHNYIESQSQRTHSIPNMSNLGESPVLFGAKIPMRPKYRNTEHKSASQRKPSPPLFGAILCKTKMRISHVQDEGNRRPSTPGRLAKLFQRKTGQVVKSHYKMMVRKHA